MRILAADDDYALQRLLHYFLKEHETTIVSSAEEVLAKMQEDTFDILFLDVNFGNNMSGTEALPLIRFNAPDVPIYALTGEVFPEEQAKLIAAGFTAVITKPFTATDLIDVLNP
jgi:CheY-like chemotaxis protein